MRVGQRNAWTEALDQAVADEQTGMVVLLCAVGMQTGDWRGVPPQALYRIVEALRSVGWTRGTDDRGGGDRPNMKMHDAALVDRFLEMMAAEAGAAGNTLAAYRSDLRLGRRGDGRA